MAATVTVVSRRSVGDEWEVRATLNLGTYATRGVETTNGFLADLGLMSIRDAKIDPKSGYVFEWVPAMGLVKAYRSAAQEAHTHDLKYIGGITATEPVAIDGGDTLGKNAATDRTIAGADSATKGGVVSGDAIAQAALAEVSNSVDLSTTPGDLVMTVRGL